ncbi:zona pellucida sperm-binding protein 3-like [Genypterus blacodes]|uniref:zona pellucida sperm-binding protein 3-like n=1 Tax=Genypterus blacodes TaxID=154954 RepID=UPI003F75B88D
MRSAADTRGSTSALRRRNVFKLDRTSTQRSPGPPPPSTPGFRSGAKIRSGSAHLPDVSVSCSASDFVVRIRAAFYGLGAEAEELKLGDSCHSNGVLWPHSDLLFTYPLTHCEVQRQTHPGFLVYKFVLHYEPSPSRAPSNAHQMDIDIECRFQRYHHIHRLAVQPTWQSATLHKKLRGRPSDFQIQLMDDSWSRPAETQAFRLGQMVHFQVSAPHIPAGGKLYVSSCYASTSNHPASNLKYAIIDNFGCMLDSQRDPGASGFISRTDKSLRFSLNAFQFISDPDAEVHIQCKFFVTSEDPSPVRKSCTYRENRWTALTGDDSICACCDSRCVTSKARRAMMEGSASSEPLLVSDQPIEEVDDFLHISSSPVSIRRQDELEVHNKKSHHIDDLDNDEDPWETTDIEEYDEEDDDYENQRINSEDEKGMETGSEFDALDFRTKLSVEERKDSFVMDVSEFGDEGSGYEEREGSELRVAEEREDEIYHVKQLVQVNDDEPRHLIQLEELLPSDREVNTQRRVQPLEEEQGKEAVRGEEDERMKADLPVSHTGDDTEAIWYFTWR